MVTLPTTPPAWTALHRVPAALRHLLVALAYAVLALAALRYFPPAGEPVSLFWPAIGWALAVTLLGGRTYILSSLAGLLLAHHLADSSLIASLGDAAGTGLVLLLTQHQLSRDRAFDPSLRTAASYRRLLLNSLVPITVLCTLGALVTLGLSRGLSPEPSLRTVLHWWMGGVLGIAIVTPLVLISALQPLRRESIRWVEFFLLMALTVAVGQAVFLGWLADILPGMPRKGYWIFPLVAWGAARLGRRAVLLQLAITAVQSMVSASLKTGVLATHYQMAGPLDAWAYLLIVGLMGLALATTLHEMRQASSDLRIAATAFECQEGIIITDADLRILRTNQSFSRITGYSQEEVLGQTTTFMRSDRHPPGFYENAWRTAREQGLWNDEVWHRRKNGEVFPQWLTATAVKDARGVITNFVVTHTDISYRKRKEAEVLTSQIAQRDALVREVHHRIKNNLQGITGLLRQFVHAYPETAEPINQAIGQVRSIAVIHGLQGRSSERTVRLCELTGEIARDIAAVWQVPVRVDIPAPWTPCLIAESEAVPLALVLNELITNAVKHGSQQATGVEVRLRKGDQPDHVQIRISNTGVWQGGDARAGASPVRSGLQLVEAMLPRSGAQLLRDHEDGMIHVWLMLAPPVISLETERNPHVPDPDTQSPAAAGG